MFDVFLYGKNNFTKTFSKYQELNVYTESKRTAYDVIIFTFEENTFNDFLVFLENVKLKFLKFSLISILLENIILLDTLMKKKEESWFLIFKQVT